MKTKYNVGDPFDVTGGKLVITYDDETTETINLTENMIEDYEDYSELTKGTHEIIVTYEGYEGQIKFEIEVTDGEVPTGIKVTSDKYTVDDEKRIIKGINPQTGINEFYTNIEIEPEEGIEKYIEEDEVEVEEGIVATEMKLVIKQGGEEKLRYALVVRGDIHPNGRIDIRDIVSVAISIIRNGLSDEQKMAGDINGDGNCNIKDIVLMAKIIARLTTIDEIK